MRLGMLSLVVNPAEGLGEFEMADLKGIYERCGPIMGRFVIEAIANAEEATGAGTGRSPSRLRSRSLPGSLATGRMQDVQSRSGDVVSCWP